MTKNNKNQHAQELGRLGAASRWKSHKPLTEEEKKARHAAAQKRYRDKKRWPQPKSSSGLLPIKNPNWSGKSKRA